MLEMLKGDNATCNRCLAHWKKWAGNSPKKVRELSRKYCEEHKEQTKAYNQECESCGCKVKKCNWLIHLGTEKQRDGVENGRGGGDTGGEGKGAGGRS